MHHLKTMNSICLFEKKTPLSLFLTTVCQPLFRVERLWSDIWSCVTSNYYNALHSLEEDGFIDLSNEIHLFCVQYVFIPRLRSDLQHFIDSWNNHPISTEANLTPQQMWTIGMLQAPVPEPNYAEVGMQ